METELFWSKGRALQGLKSTFFEIMSRIIRLLFGRNQIINKTLIKCSTFLYQKKPSHMCSQKHEKLSKWLEKSPYTILFYIKDKKAAAAFIKRPEPNSFFMRWERNSAQKSSKSKIFGKSHILYYDMPRSLHLDQSPAFLTLWRYH